MSNTHKPDPEMLDSDNPEWTEKMLAEAKPASEVLPNLINRRGKQKTPTKISTTIRLSPEVIEHFKASGSGWQTRIDEALKDHIATHPEAA